MQKTAVFSTLSSDKSDSDDGQTSIEEKKVPLFFSAKIEQKFKHGPGRLGIKGEVQNTINVDVISPKWSKSVLRPCGGRPLVVVAVETPA